MTGDVTPSGAAATSRIWRLAIQRHQTDLISHPALVTGAAGRVALHRARQADAERGWLRRPAARLQHGQAALETGREDPRRDRLITCLWACPQTRCHPIR